MDKKVKRNAQKIIMCFWVSIMSLVVTVSLGGVAFSFGTAAVLLLGISITNLFGITHIPYNIGFTMVGSGFMQLGISLFVGIVFVLVARVCWIQLQNYFKFAAKFYVDQRF